MDSPADMNSPATWLELAEMKLDHARQIFEIGLYDDTLSRAYYAMFYAAKAALLSEGVTCACIPLRLQNFVNFL